MRHVLARFVQAQRIQVIARNHPLRQLFQRRIGHHGAQLGLADQDDLQQLALTGFQVGEQPQLLQHVGRQVLRLVDDQHVVAAARIRVEQEGIERIDAILDRFHARHRR
ncbi:hypothetical protein SDC9_83449 [bioreactor metagenome]|uniref:Uncharacterized protein n=1 Tax=bioreactor metagenome TaxID=1076179 RepID=A0A644Z7K7_9ZZZZ